MMSFPWLTVPCAAAPPAVASSKAGASSQPAAGKWIFTLVLLSSPNRYGDSPARSPGGGGATAAGAPRVPQPTRERDWALRGAAATPRVAATRRAARRRSAPPLDPLLSGGLAGRPVSTSPATFPARGWVRASTG